MTWSYFIIFAIISVICWAVGAVASWKEKKTMGSVEKRWGNFLS